MENFAKACDNGNLHRRKLRNWGICIAESCEPAETQCLQGFQRLFFAFKPILSQI